MTPKAELQELVTAIRACTLCPKMHRPAVSGGAVMSKVISVGQAPGAKEPILGRPFAWTAGKTLYKWFTQACGWTEDDYRSHIYMAAVARCFPGKGAVAGDRVPDPGEIQTCGRWMQKEIEILQPALVLPIGKLAIAQFVEFEKLTEVIGGQFTVTKYGHTFDLIPLPHPSGASTWHRMEPGKTLLEKALKRAVNHPAWPRVSRT